MFPLRSITFFTFVKLDFQGVWVRVAWVFVGTYIQVLVGVEPEVFA